MTLQLLGVLRPTNILGTSKFICALFVLFSLSNHNTFSQNYSFKNYLKDNKIRDRLNEFNSIRQIDSVGHHLKKYKDHLRYDRYLYTAIVLNNQGNDLANRYLDTAFMLGLSFPCIQKELFKQYDTNYVKLSFKKNYLKAFDQTLIAVLDSLRTEDQKYRFKIKAEMPKSLKDSLWLLQEKIDSSNLIFYKKQIAEKGWPSFKKVGGVACGYSPPSPNLLIVHSGVKERVYQIALIEKTMALCAVQQEDWKNIIWLLSDLYYRSHDSLRELSFLKVTGNKLEKDESLFSLYCITELLTKMPSKKIVILCKDEKLFDSIKSSMLDMNNWVVIPYVDEEMAKQFKIAIPKKLVMNSFLFEKNGKMPDGQVFFKLINKEPKN